MQEDLPLLAITPEQEVRDQRACTRKKPRQASNNNLWLQNNKYSQNQGFSWLGVAKTWLCYASVGNSLGRVNMSNFGRLELVG